MHQPTLRCFHPKPLLWACPLSSCHWAGCQSQPHIKVRKESDREPAARSPSAWGRAAAGTLAEVKSPDKEWPTKHDTETHSPPVTPHPSTQPHNTPTHTQDPEHYTVPQDHTTAPPALHTNTHTPPQHQQHPLQTRHPTYTMPLTLHNNPTLTQLHNTPTHIDADKAVLVSSPSPFAFSLGQTLTGNKSRRWGEGDFLVAQWLRLRVPNAGGSGSISGQRTRSHKSPLKILHAATKIQHSQINNVFFLKRVKVKEGGRTACKHCSERSGVNWACLCTTRRTWQGKSSLWASLALSAKYSSCLH